GNLASLGACITRLRVTVKDAARVREDELRALGASGVVVIGNAVQAVFGPVSENLETDMQEYLATAGAGADAPAPVLPPAVEPQAQPGAGRGAATPGSPAPGAAPLLAALGGR